MRLLDEGNKIFDLEHLGLTERDRKTIQTLIDKPHGMIVVTGPTGSGKSTTMYAMLSKLNAIDTQHRDGRRPGRISPAGHQPGALATTSTAWASPTR